MSDGTRIKIHDDELECPHCEEYNEVEVLYDLDTLSAHWTCPNEECGAENTLFEDDLYDEEGEPYDDWS